MTAGGVDFGHIAGRARRGRRSDAAVRNGQRLSPIACRISTAARIEVIVGPGTAALGQFAKLGHGIWHFAHQKALVDRGARCNGPSPRSAAGSRRSINTWRWSATMPKPGQRRHVHRRQAAHFVSHAAASQPPNCRSDLLYKGALQDKSRHRLARHDQSRSPAAQKTNGYQRNDNLMLSITPGPIRSPAWRSKPTTSAARTARPAGRVDDEHDFLRHARGLTRKEATRLIVTGFFQQVFDRITIESVRNALGEAIKQRIREFE